MPKLNLDRERNLSFDLNALALVEEQVGKTAMEIAKLQKLGCREVRALLWAGLLADDPNLTLEQAGKLVTAKNLGPIVKAIVEGLNDFFVPKN